MDEFNRVAWERDRAINRYPRLAPIGELADPPRWTIGGIVAGLVIATLCGLVIWRACDDLTEHFKPAPPVPVQEETRPDISGQIRTLERMIVEVKQLNADIQDLHKLLTK